MKYSLTPMPISLSLSRSCSCLQRRTAKVMPSGGPVTALVSGATLHGRLSLLLNVS